MPTRRPRSLIPTTSLAPRLGLDANAPAWEVAMEHIMQSPSTDGVRALALFGLLPQVPEEGLQTVGEQAAAWLRDSDYTAVAAPLLLDPSTHGFLLSALYADVMERPDEIALPALYAIANTPSHPYAAAARDNLALLLNLDATSELPAFETAIRQRLANTPPVPTPIPTEEEPASTP